MNVSAGRGVAVREFKLVRGHGYADYLLFVDGKAAGVLEAKAEGHTLVGVEPQAKKYAEGLPPNLDPQVAPLPFLYISDGGATRFTNLLDRKPRSRRIFQIHRPETLAEWLGAETLDTWVKTLREEDDEAYSAADDTRPSSLRARMSTLRPLDPPARRRALPLPQPVRGHHQPGAVAQARQAARAHVAPSSLLRRSRRRTR